jgi:glutamate-ammonia-ligase adenylyltransferase
MLNIRPIADTPEAALQIAAEHSPYLRQIAETLDVSGSADGLLKTALADIAAATGETKDVMSVLRRSKQRAHYAIAGLDLAGQATCEEITAHITALADQSVQAALACALQSAGLKGDGLFLVALGKMGAYELNYSSDIDMAAFFDADIFDGGSREPADAASRVIRDTMRILSERTPDGYVFRTDLRLRPDPSSTPLAVAVRRAELYYESVGQNWERMVWIKGRVAAGDIAAGESFIQTLEPFVWRRHLDYWAIADVHAIKSMINSKVGDTSLQDTAADVKLGPGGIREIEFFAQTQQIILGGRNPDLRVRGTLEALDKLVELGIVMRETANDMSRAYRALRAVEHRIQMLDDAQTHTLPSFENRRASVAALCGYSALDVFDADLIETRRLVHRHYQDLFAQEDRQKSSPSVGNLVFTGVDDDPRTLETLTGLGFKTPSAVIERIRQWHRGRTPATRTVRGRELLTAVLPDLLRCMGETGEADSAFSRFGKFFEGLRSGVQTLSMLAAEVELMEDLVTTLAIAPKIADTLSKRPGLLEALLSVSDRKTSPDLNKETDFETALNAMRRWHGERSFIIGHKLLHGKLAASEAAEAWTSLADICVAAMADAAEAETIRRYGAAPGQWCVVGLGKLGGREMTAGSDLDLLVIYEASDADNAQTWFTRFTQRLIAALSSETGEGELYEVDMRLRPSGRAGPVATSIAAFERYHSNDAWTWEHMTLTRLRIVAADQRLGQDVCDIAQRVIAQGDVEKRTVDILEMRERLHRDKPASGPWDLKMRKGGLVDLEFIIQHALLTAPLSGPLRPSLSDAVEALAGEGAFTDDEAASLRSCFSFLQSLQQVQRIAVGGDTSAQIISAALADRLCRATGASNFTELEQELESVCSVVSSLFSKRLQLKATDI